MSSKAIIHDRSSPYISISYHHHLRREGKGQQSQSQIIHTSANLFEGLSRKQFVKLFWRTLTQLSLAPALQLRWHPCVQHICKVTQVFISSIYFCFCCLSFLKFHCPAFKPAVDVVHGEHVVHAATGDQVAARREGWGHHPCRLQGYHLHIDIRIPIYHRNTSDITCTQT